MEEAPARDRLDLVMGAVLVVVSVLVIQAVGTYAFHVDATVRITYAVVTLGLLAVWGVAAVMRPAYRPSTVLAGPLVLALLAFGASVLASQRPRLSLEPALVGVASALTLLTLTALLRVVTIRRLLAIMLLLLPIVLSVAYVAVVATEWVRWWSLVGRVTAPPLRPSFVDLSLGSPNLVATYLIVFAPLSAALATRRFGVWAGAVCLALAGVALLLTGSRSAYLAAAVAAVVALGLGLVTFRSVIGNVVTRLGRRKLAFGLAGSAIAIGLIAILVGPGLLARITLTGADHRSWFWRSALELFGTSPLVGTGPGTWAQLKLATALPTEVNAVQPHAHSLVFQTIAEVGLLGAAGLVVLAAAVAWRAREAGRRADGWTRIELIAAAAGLLGLIVQQGTDYLMNLPAVVMGASILVGWIDTVEGRRREGPRSSIARWSGVLAGPVAIVLGIVLVASLPVLVGIGGAMGTAERANLAAAVGDWQTALDGYDRAVADDPDFTLYRVERANALAHLGRLAEARDEYAATAGTDLLAANLIALATLDLETGMTAKAADTAREALLRGPNDPMVELNAGRILEAAGDLAGATTAYAAAVLDDPPLAASAWWDSTDRTVPFADVILQARAGARAAGNVFAAALISAYAGRIDEARQDIAALGPPGSTAFLSEIIEGIGGDRQAGMAALRARVEAAPNDFQSLIWLIQILRFAGDPAADTFEDQALVLRRDEAGGLVLVRSVVPATGAQRNDPVPGYPYAIYSRKGQVDPLPPQVLVIGALGRS